MSRQRIGAVPAVVIAIFLLAAGPALATPANVPSEATARTELGTLTVSAEGPMTGYSRDLFPHWSIVSGSCDSRELVLQRDGTNVTSNAACQAVSGTWESAYDGVTISSSSDVDIDHVVPLAEAWRSGASSWTTSHREEFANEQHWPQLIAVSASSNRSKGDQDPSTWKPPVASYDCRYARMWIRVKYEYTLALQSTEKSALQEMLDGC